MSKNEKLSPLGVKIAESISKFMPEKADRDLFRKVLEKCNITSNLSDDETDEFGKTMEDVWKEKSKETD